MLNLFPELLTYSLLAPFILRVVLGFTLINLGLLKLGTEKENWQFLIENFVSKKFSSSIIKIVAVVEITGGFLLILGMYTQVLALIFSALILIHLLLDIKEESLVKRNLVFYLLILAISISLLFSGAGAFAVDLAI